MKYIVIFTLISFIGHAQMIYEKVPIQQEVVVVNSTANANNPFQNGDDRIYIPFTLPTFTNGYFLRITVVQKEKIIPVEKTDLFSEIISFAKDKTAIGTGKALLAKLSIPPAADNIDVFIIDGRENVLNFDRKNDGKWQTIYSMKNTVSTNAYFDIIPNEGYICLRNMHWDQGMQVKVEIVAERGWGKSSKQYIYDHLKEKLSSVEGITEEQINSFIGCVIKKITSKSIIEISEMIEYELLEFEKNVMVECESQMK
jgi:hypothetical protein